MKLSEMVAIDAGLDERDVVKVLSALDAVVADEVAAGRPVRVGRIVTLKPRFVEAKRGGQQIVIAGRELTTKPKAARITVKATVSSAIKRATPSTRSKTGRLIAAGKAPTTTVRRKATVRKAATRSRSTSGLTPAQKAWETRRRNEAAKKRR
jgi:hypothetical protein